MIGPGFGEHVGALVAKTVLRWLVIATLVGAVIGVGVAGQVARERSEQMATLPTSAPVDDGDAVVHEGPASTEP